MSDFIYRSVKHIWDRATTEYDTALAEENREGGRHYDPHINARAEDAYAPPEEGRKP